MISVTGGASHPAKRERESKYNELLERIKKQRGSIIEYITNTAENSSRTNKVLIFSWVYQCNCTVTEISKKRTIQRYLYSPPGRTERQRPAYDGLLNAIVCVSYSQHPIMAEEKRSQERGRIDWALQRQCSRSSRRSRGITDLGENLRGEGKAPLERLPLSPWVVSLVHSSNVIK